MLITTEPSLCPFVGVVVVVVIVAAAVLTGGLNTELGARKVGALSLSCELCPEPCFFFDFVILLPQLSHE